MLTFFKKLGLLLYAIELTKHNYICGILNVTVMEGNLTTIMAGLNCGTPSHLGWRILKRSAEAFLSCEDQITIIGMNKLYFPSGEDMYCFLSIITISLDFRVMCKIRELIRYLYFRS